MVEKLDETAHFGAFIEAGEEEKVDKVERDVEYDEEELQCGKLQGASPVAEVGEGDALEGIDGHAHGHHAEELGMGGIVEGFGDGGEETEHEGHEGEAHAAHEQQRGGVDALRVLPFFVDEAEEGGFHAEGEQHEQECHVAVHLGDNAVAARGGGELGRVERHEEVVQEAADNAGEAVDGGVLRKGFHAALLGGGG